MSLVLLSIKPTVKAKLCIQKTMNNADKWLKIAQKDFKDARIEELSIENRLYHCQQAAEKALKAVLVYHEKNYPFTHDISDLITTIQNHNISIPKELIAASRLTRYAVETRYPSPGSDKWNEKEYKKAATLADKTVAWAKNIIKNS